MTAHVVVATYDSHSGLGVDVFTLASDAAADEFAEQHSPLIDGGECEVRVIHQVPIATQGGAR